MDNYTEIDPRRNKKFSSYIRSCSKCGNRFRTPFKRGKVCSNCLSRRELKKKKNAFIRLDRLLEEIEYEIKHGGL